MRLALQWVDSVKSPLPLDAISGELHKEQHIMSYLTISVLFCAVSFYIYGWSCLKTKYMAREFKRYRLSGFRKLTGILQLLGATGLILGLAYKPVAGFAAAGLSLQMACGLGVRIGIKDEWYQCIPAAFYMIVCGAIATQFL